MKNNESYAWLIEVIDSGSPLGVIILAAFAFAAVFSQLINNGQVLHNIFQSRFATRVERLEVALASKSTNDATKKLLTEQLESEYASLFFKKQTSSQYRDEVAAVFESAAGGVSMSCLVRAGKYLFISDGSLIIKLTRWDKAAALFCKVSIVFLFLLFALIILVAYIQFLYGVSFVDSVLILLMLLGLTFSCGNSLGPFKCAEHIKNHLESSCWADHLASRNKDS